MAVEQTKTIITSVLIVTLFSHIVKGTDISTTCDHPGEPVNGAATPDRQEYLLGEEITFTCSQSLILIGEDKAECLGNNLWSSPVPFCGRNVGLGKQTQCLEKTWEKDMNMFSPVTDGILLTCLRIKKKLSLLSYFPTRANISYVVIHVKEIATPNLNINVQIFSALYPKTRGKSCVRNNVVNSTFTKIYAFQCSDLYYPVDAEAIQVSFSSTVEVDLCEILAFSGLDRKCPTPEVCYNCEINNTRNVYVEYKSITPDCSISSEESKRYCINKIWIGKTPECKGYETNANLCGKPEIPAHGRLFPDYDHYKEGDGVTVICDDGYEIFSKHIRICRFGKWMYLGRSTELYCDKNIMFNQQFSILTQTEKKCLTHLTDGDFASISSLILNNYKTLSINLMETYEIEMFIFTMNLKNLNNVLSIDIEIGCYAKDNSRFHLCERIKYRTGSWINDTIKFTCQGNSISCNKIELNFIGNQRYSISVNLQEFQILTTQTDVGFKRLCKIKQHSPNCMVKEIFNSDGVQHLLYYPEPDYSLYGEKLIRCFNGSWENKPPICVNEISIIEAPKESNPFTTWGIVFFGSVIIVVGVGRIILFATNRTN